MQNIKLKELDKILSKGEIKAEKGSRKWSMLIRYKMQVSIDVMLLAIQLIEECRSLMVKYNFDLLDSEDEPFAGSYGFSKFPRFAKTSRPYGLSCSDEIINEAIYLKEKIHDNLEEVINVLNTHGVTKNLENLDLLLNKYGFYFVGVQDNMEIFCRLYAGKAQFVAYSRQYKKVWLSNKVF